MGGGRNHKLKLGHVLPRCSCSLGGEVEAADGQPDLEIREEIQAGHGSAFLWDFTVLFPYYI